MWNASPAEWPLSGAGLGPGAVLCGRYVLEQRLEQGRLGAVYRAVDRQDPRVRVAVLLLPGEVGGNERMTAAVREDFARLSALKHPNIAEVLEFDRDGGTCFLTFEWVDGESLESVLESSRPQKLDPRDAFAVLRGVGAALGYAHTRGVAHGDVRPENVIVSGRGEVKLLFASTCLLRSAPFTVDAREDVYGLGCLAHELLTGRAPVGGYHSPSAAERREAHRRPKGLTGRQWAALCGALAPRDRRIRSVGALLNGLGVARAADRRARGRPDGTGRVWKIAALLLLSAAVVAAFQLDPARVERWRAAVPATLEQAVAPVAALIRRDAGTAASTRFVFEPLPATVEEPVQLPAPPSASAPAERPPVPADFEIAALAPTPAEPLPAEPVATTAERPAERAAERPAERAADRPAERAPAAATGAAFTRREVAVSEAASAVALEIRRTGGDGPLTVAWWTSDGTAIAGEDYASFGAVIETFAPGETSRTIYVPITADTLPEEPEYFYVSLRVGESASSAVTRATITIIDDD